jgi:hypothetical protein
MNMVINLSVLNNASEIDYCGNKKFPSQEALYKAVSQLF